RFFREKNRAFAPRTEELIHYDDENFKSCLKLGEIKLGDAGHLLICAFKVTQQLTERSGKKAQYEKTRKILKDTQSDAGIFIFYDQNGNFRFSLIYANYMGRKRDWSNFRRFTYFVSKEFTNKTFLKRIGEGDFSSLEKIKDAFSVEKVTREFYRDISYWYRWAVRETQFPRNAEEEDNGRNIAVIRLITRLTFIWFMRERGLVANNLFDKDNIINYLKDLAPSKTTYYKAILQNLFFATLNTKIKDRKFRFSKSFQGRNVHYMDPSIYRYEDYFKNRKDMLDIFKEIPFLNGGLFDCLDRRVSVDEKNVEIRIDGFSDKEVGVKVPNFLFFSDETDVDLNRDFGTKNKKYKSQGLINILTAYNFTIDENDPDDQEVALDPELLGKVFENLLASFNPETSSTARKATGSYYTPREIVDYMVTQSLKEYFKTHLKDVKGLDKKLEELFAAGTENNPFAERDTKIMVNLIDSLRIVDPAVGSGAFPMGILNKLVFILSKLDPENARWKGAQIKAVEENITDPVLKNRLKEQIASQFEEKYSDYGRKLYLIQKCIYGVDIQQIAVEIAKLRFFISLLVDEKIDKSRENCGIEPLPNLDYKIMQGNSLVEEYEGIKLFDEKLMTSTPFEQIQIQGLEERVSQLSSEEIRLHESGKLTHDRKRDLYLQMKEARNSLKKLKRSQGTEKEQGQLNFRSDGKKKGEELKRLHNDFFASTQKREKDTLKKRIEVLEWEFIEATLKEQNRESAIREIEKFKKSNTKPFFLWKLYCSDVFQEKSGFDVVIGNPPYVQIQKFSGKKEQKDWENENYRTYTKTGDIYCLFYEKGNMLLRDNGVLAFITSNKWMRANYGKKTREYFLNEVNINQLIDFGDSPIFENATTYTNILLFSKGENENQPHVWDLSREYEEDTSLDRILVDNKSCSSLFNEDAFVIVPKEQSIIKKRIEEISSPLKDWDIEIYRGILTGFNEAFIINGSKKDELIGDDPKNAEIIKPVLRGRDIKRYKAEFADLWLINTHNGYFDKDQGRIQPINIDDYPDTKEHLDLYWKELERRQDKGATPYNLRNCAYLQEFEKEKIVYSEIVYDSAFCYEDKGLFAEATVFILTGTKLKYLTAMLNSKLLTYAFRTFYAGGDLRGNTFRYKKVFLENLPIPKVSVQTRKPFTTLVDQILSITKSEDYSDNPEKQSKVKEIEKEIDKLVYKLYGLSEEEIKIVEG
ncbi:MAG: Eco57I restriction-modification methylase domain-containing protein, partial [Thermodesulfobacteriota bacterium]